MNPKHIKDLVPDPENRRAHNARNLGMVADALHAVGAARSIVIDEDNVILAGNGLTEAAAVAGITKVRVIEADGNEIIAVRRSGLTAEQKRALALYDNRTAELATWDVDQLRDDLQGGADLAPYFFESELAALGCLGEAVADPRAEWTGMPEYDQKTINAFHTITVHFKDAAAVEAFAAMVGQPVTQKVRYLWIPEQVNAVFKDKRYA